MMWGGGLPKPIAKLIHLRFLAIFQTNIRELPDSVRNLRNLLFLWYVSDEEEVEVPNGLVCKMESLRELTLPSYLKRGSESFNYTFGLSVCKNLQALRSGAGTRMMEDLPTLSLTVQSLTIVDIQTPEETNAIYECPSVKEDRLCTLTCDVYNPGLEFDLRRIRHCETLQSLELYKCALTFGELEALEFPPNLVKLCLSNNKVEERDYDLMQVLGELSNLRTLSLFNVYNGKRLSCKSSAFPRLQELEMEYLFGLEEWIVEEGAMARIGKLRINFCRRLKRLPPSIRFITSLKKLEVTYMSEEFCKSLGLGGGSSLGEDCYISQHIPSVKFNCY